MRVLKELYYGNISPNERTIAKGSKYESVLNVLTRDEALLSDLLSGAELDLFNEYGDAQAELNSITAVENFVYGFRLEAKVGLEIGEDADGQPVEIG